MNETSPTNHHAFGAIDDKGHGYVVLDPINRRDCRLERLALPLTHGGLVQAEELAEEFNEGTVWAFKGSPLRGAAIPRLHRGPAR
jgi:hypothetical protein